MDVVAQRVSFEGDLLWGDGAIVTAATGHQQHEQTIGAGDGGAFVAVWDVHDALYDLQGRRSGGPAGVPLTTVPDGQFLRGIAYSAVGDRILAVWDDRER